MSKNALPALWGIAAGALILAAGACSDDQSINLTGGGPDAEVDSGSPTLDGYFPTDDVQEEDALGNFKCSVDLHQVLDADDNVVKTCPDDQGCELGSGKCVAPCDSSISNQSALGCDYYSVQPDGSTSYGICYAVFVQNTWTTPVTIGAEMNGVPYNLDDFARIPSGSGQTITYAPLTNGQIPPNQTAILFISGVACPDGVFPPNMSANTTGTVRGQAFHITSDRPVVAQDIYPYGWASAAITSATLLLPTSAWDVNYMAIDQYSKSTETAYPMALQIVAQEDSTTVTVLPTADVAAALGVTAATKNVPTTYTIDKGEVLSLTTPEGLSGSILKSSKPIGTWASIGCFNVPPGQKACDSGHQQIPPVRALGSEYVGVAHRQRRVTGATENPPWRFMGLVDGTTLTYEPTAPAGAPTSLKAGEVAIFRTPGPFVVKSQDDDHPFYMSAHMTSCGDYENKAPGDACDFGEGDPESINVVPAKQLVSSYRFFTDPSYSDTSLVVVRSSAKGGFKDVTLDCAGKLTGWQPVDSSGNYEYTRINLVTGNFVGQNGCDNGAHSITSEGQFGATVWGWGSDGEPDNGAVPVSYAYPAGLSVRAINKVVINPVPR